MYGFKFLSVFQKNDVTFEVGETQSIWGYVEPFPSFLSELYQHLKYHPSHKHFALNYQGDKAKI